MTVNGGASNRKDYVFRSGTLRFGPGESSKSLALLITDDVFVEADETLAVTRSDLIHTVASAR
jgi:Calx-beta domain